MVISFPHNISLTILLKNNLENLFFVKYIYVFFYISRDCSVEFDKYYSILIPCTMNHSRITLAITAIVAAAALATIAFAAPQQVMAGGHHNHNNNSHDGIKVDQQVNQENQCSEAICANIGFNNATIHH